MSLLPIAGFVLAGGRSSRMGRDKALLLMEGTTLIERALGKLHAVCASVAIAGGGEALAGFGRVVPDGVPECGPLGGIVGALESCEFEWCLFMPVDVPLLSVDFLQALGRRCLASTALAVIPRVNGRPEPLCAGYSRRALPQLREALQADRYKVVSAAESAGEVEYFDVLTDGEQFANLNTPEEFLAAREDRSEA